MGAKWIVRESDPSLSRYLAQQLSISNAMSSILIARGFTDADRARAFAPKPGAFALLPGDLGGRRVKILDAMVEPADAGAAAPGEVIRASAADGLVVGTGEGAVRIFRVHAEGGRAMDVTAFLSGHKLAPGQVLGDGPG